MTSREYQHCKDRQKSWAAQNGIRLQGSKGRRGEPAYTYTLEDNLFEPLSDQARREFEKGDGEELKAKGGPPKMHAVHSSAALTVNVFHYWRFQSDRTPLAKVLGLHETEIVCLRFERKRRIMAAPDRQVFPKDPNLDVTLRFAKTARLREIALECKFTEPYWSREPEKSRLAAAYLRKEDLWPELPNCHQLARGISPSDDRFQHFHAAQLLKHILGLKHRNGRTGFKLLYLWYDVVGSDDADRHRHEIDEFRGIVDKDGVAFEAMTFQEVIERLRSHRIGHERYVDYLVARYLLQ